ncbi:TPA: hypothetical protein ENS27_09130 [bacterium]|nr:hypothetical protein [bacterium]
MKITAVYADEEFAKPIFYTFNLIFSILGIEHKILSYNDLSKSVIDNSDLVISYGYRKPEQKFRKHIHIYQSSLFGKDYRTPSSMPKLPLKRWNDLPIIYEGNANLKKIVIQNEYLIETNIDIITSSFFMLTRYEEYLINDRDQYDRFPAESSIAYKEGFLTKPIVNEYIELLADWIRFFYPDFKRGKLWNDADFGVLLTHDIDKVKKYRWWRPPIYSFIRSLKEGRIDKTLKYLSDWFASSFRLKVDPYWNFSQISNLENNYGFKSSFYFMTNQDSEREKLNQYSVNEPNLAKEIKKLEEMDNEIGLHGSFNSFNDQEMYLSEKARLDQVVNNKYYGGRQHYLRWKTPDTWRILEQAGILYDTTLGYDDHNGFRCGFCLPYKPFDVIEDRVINILEIPLIVMDRTLQKKYIDPNEMWWELEILIKQVQKHNGIFVLLWHNSSLYDIDYPTLNGMYNCILKRLNELNSIDAHQVLFS